MMMMMMPSMCFCMIASVAAATVTAIASNFDRYHVRLGFLLATPTISSAAAVVYEQSMPCVVVVVVSFCVNFYSCS